MTQLQFDMTCKIVQNGAPALADELCGSLNNLIVDYNRMAEQLKAAQEAIEQYKEISKDENVNEAE
jgi:hypothetical protein